MPVFARSDLADLAVFTTIVRRRSFKAAAIELDLTTSALSHTMRRLEQRLGTRLLNRTSRSVAPTATGLALAHKLDAGFEQIGTALADIETQQMHPTGELRLNVPGDASRLLIGPVLAPFTMRYPDVHLTVVVENRPVDVVAEGFDAGIRYGDTVPEDMVAVALTPPLEWVIVAAPAYLDRYGRPRVPADLKKHACLRMLLGDNSAFRWELGNGEAMMRLDVPGRCTINDTETTIGAAIGGLGLAYTLRKRIETELDRKLLEIVLPDWSSTGAGFHMYYPGRRQNHPALLQLIGLIRAREGLPPLAR